MPVGHARIVWKALRDGAIGLAVYSGIVIIALEDRAQAGSSLPALPSLYANTSSAFWSDPSVLTLFVLGLLFATLTAFTLSVWRHLGRNFALSRVGTAQAQIWSIAANRTYRKKP